MKKRVAVVRIKSFTDVITNSSSEVFVCHNDCGIKIDDDNRFKIDIDKITWDFLKDQFGADGGDYVPGYIINQIIDLAELSVDDELIESIKFYWKDDVFFYNPNKEQYYAFLEKFKKEIQEKIIDRDYYEIFISDYVDSEGNVICGYDLVGDNYVWTESLR